MDLEIDPELQHLTFAIAHDPASALSDPRIPLLPLLHPRMANTLEKIASEFVHVVELDDRDTFASALELLHEQLWTMLVGGKVYEGDRAFFLSEDAVNRFQEGVAAGVFEDDSTWTKGPEDLAIIMVLQIVRRAIARKTDRRAVVSRFDQRT